MNILIDPEFRDLLGPMDKDARQTLEASLQAEGCRNALVVWPQLNGTAILLDGHARFDICQRYGIAYSTVNCPETVIDRESAMVWIMKNLLARRHTSSQA